MIMIMSKAEYFEKYNLESGDAPELDIAEKIICNENEECPIVGVVYPNGEKWVYGAKYDRQVENIDEIIKWLEEIR